MMEELSLLEELALLEGMDQTEYIGGVKIVEAFRDNDDLFDLHTREKIQQTRDELETIFDCVITVINAPAPEPFVYQGHNKHPEYSPFVDMTESEDQAEVTIPKTVISTGVVNMFPLPPNRKKVAKRVKSGGLRRAGRPTKRKSDRPRFYDKEAH